MHRREFHDSNTYFFTTAVVNSHVRVSSLELEHVDEHGGRAHDGGRPLLRHRPHGSFADETVRGVIGPINNLNLNLEP